jgi:hypothetical protein
VIGYILHEKKFHAHYFWSRVMVQREPSIY